MFNKVLNFIKNFLELNHVKHKNYGQDLDGNKLEIFVVFKDSLAETSMC